MNLVAMNSIKDLLESTPRYVAVPSDADSDNGFPDSAEVDFDTWWSNIHSTEMDAGTKREAELPLQKLSKLPHHNPFTYNVHPWERPQYNPLTYVV